MARVIYGGRAIIPAPLVNVTKNYIKSGDGNKLGVLYNLTLTGTLLPFRGSPSGTFVSPDDAFWILSGEPPDESFEDNDGAFSHLIKKEEAIRHLFSTEGQLLEIYAGASPAIIRCNPRILSIIFTEGQWVDRKDYTITLEADWIFIAGLSSDTEDTPEVELINSGQEQWSFDEKIGLSGTIYEVSHTVSAQGIYGYDEMGIPFSGVGETPGGESWKHAKRWCDNRVVGVINPDVMFSIIGVSGLIGGSYVKNTNLTNYAGEYSITERWILSPSTYFIEKSFSINKNVGGTVDVSYQGKITGLSEGESTGGPLAIVNAKVAIPTNTQAKTETEIALGLLLEDFILTNTPSQKNISINNTDATITFSFNWATDEFGQELFTRTCEANLAFDTANGSYNLSLSCDIKGFGETSAEKLTNARSAVLSELDARLKAIELVGSGIPSGIIISDEFSSKSMAVNETQGSIRFGYSWKNTIEGLENFELSIDTQYPHQVVAVIPIPGRVGGPILQDMETTTQEVVTATLTSFNNDVKPDNGTIISIIEEAIGFVGTWLLQDDKENFSPTNKKYTRTRSYIVD
jgi:hypothetical protein